VGKPDHEREGEMLSPSQVYREGIAPPDLNAVLVSMNAMFAPQDVPAWSFVRLGSRNNYAVLGEREA
jgi:hypothetical protein